ncbi:hypothetical protein EJC51_12910 [Streptomyces aquilus]|uniref:Uncharacterized protein n=1 Tax=Streptomyces aquilus TaxID=2548456 RepID=A0A3S9HXZ0_9ACTN|nr:hypothetical protein [Streptomyces aquilus]AZP16942.1 hypothetical protein EJC51_12910 [Streptomyces aquilus]
MAGSQGSWTGGSLAARDLWKPKHVARAVFHPAWIPESIDPAVEQLKKIRLIAGTVAAVGVYTFVEGGFAFDEMLENMLTASVVLLFITPLTVGVMLLVWKRDGDIRVLKPPLFNSLKLLLAFVGSIVITVLLLQSAGGAGLFILLLGPLVIWLAGFVARGAWHVGANFFGTAGVHRCLPPLLATVTSWLMALPDLLTGDLHGLSLGMGVLFILGAPVTVTAIALLEMRRLDQQYGIRLKAHPATPTPYIPPMPPNAPPMPPGTPPYVPPQGNPYGGSPYGNPYGPPPGNPYGPQPGRPYNQGTNPYGPPSGNPYNGGNPYGS